MDNTFNISPYEQQVFKEMHGWQQVIQRDPNFIDRLSKKWQNKINSFIPVKVHNAITITLKQMFRVVLLGSKITTPPPRRNGNLEIREAIIKEKIRFYRHTAAAEGGITGAGGILLGLADFPLLLGIKIKLLFEIAAIYGINTSDYRERLYILYIFQLAFSSQQKRKEVFNSIQDWSIISKQLPDDIHQFDWQTFQQEYRDYLDLAKMAQLIPVIGAPIGAVVNFKLLNKLGSTAMNAYRMRIKERSLMLE